MSSAIALCNQDLDPISANHIDIVKPKDRNDVRYTRFAQALRGVLESKPEPTQISQKGNPNSAAFERLQLEIRSRVDAALAQVDRISRLTWTDTDANTSSSYSLRFAGQYVGSVLDPLDHPREGFPEYKEEPYTGLLLRLQEQSGASRRQAIEKAMSTYETTKKFCEGLPNYEEPDRKMTREQVGFQRCAPNSPAYAWTDLRKSTG
jgi:hypothetical protein